MPDPVNEDVAYLREYVKQKPGVLVSLAEYLAALDRLQARLEAAEALARAQARDVDDANADRLAAWEERDEARADAERLAERLMNANDCHGLTCAATMATPGDPDCDCGTAAALAAHTPHLTSEEQS